MSNPAAPNDTFVQGINNRGQIVGQYTTNSGTFGFVSRNGTYTPLNNSGGTSPATEAAGINNLGQIVGVFRNPSGTADQGFLYNAGTYTTLSSPLAPNNTWATGINDLGQIVGLANGASFLYDNGIYLALTGKAYTQAYGINDSGEIVGYYSDSPGLGVAATPLPAALPLFATGLGALGLVGWRRKRKVAAALAT
jgi:probable HAF family extracellular repeat protein